VAQEQATIQGIAEYLQREWREKTISELWREALTALPAPPCSSATSPARVRGARSN